MGAGGDHSGSGGWRSGNELNPGRDENFRSHQGREIPSRFNLELEYDGEVVQIDDLDLISFNRKSQVLVSAELEGVNQRLE